MKYHEVMTSKEIASASRRHIQLVLSQNILRSDAATDLEPERRSTCLDKKGAALELELLRNDLSSRLAEFEEDFKAVTVSDSAKNTDNN